jgi:curli biogenesis system outer membrane secretion channel CsgG
MKRLIPAALILSLFIVSCSSSPVKVPFEKRLKIAVGDFQNQSGDKLYNDLMYSPTGNFIYELNRFGTFRIIERERLSSILNEYKLSMTGLIDPAKGKEVGKILGVDAILYVNLTSVQYDVDEKKFDTKEIASKVESHKVAEISGLTADEELTVTVDARLISVSTGEVIAASKYENKVENSYSAVTGIASKGSKMERREAVKKILDESAHKLAAEISQQTNDNYYSGR